MEDIHRAVVAEREKITDDTSITSLQLTYKLSNGKVLMREYTLPDTSTRLAQIEQVLNCDEARTTRNTPELAVTLEHLTYTNIGYETESGDYLYMELTAEQALDLYENAIVPDCVEYGEWKTGVRNDGFQYAFVSLGNKLGMAIGTSALAGILGALQFVPNQAQNAAVQTSMHLAFSLIPGVLWLLTAAVLFFYRINKRSYNRIMTELNAKKQFEVIKND